jgi:hypothetical protein
MYRAWIAEQMLIPAESLAAVWHSRKWHSGHRGSPWCPL